MTTVSGRETRGAASHPPAGQMQGRVPRQPADGRIRTVMQVTWALVAGGMEIYSLTLASGLNPRKYRSLLAPLDAGGVLEPEVRRLQIPCFIMNRRPGIDFKLMWRLYRLFRAQRVEIVHTHQFTELFYSALGAKLAGARIVHTEHSVEHLRRRRIRLTLRLLSHTCDKVLAIGHDGERMLRETVRIPRRKLEIIRAGVDPSQFTTTREEARCALGLAPGDRVALIVARLYPEKNHLLLLDSFALVSKEVEEALLLVAGAGPEEGRIRSRAEALGIGGRVRILGARRDIPRLLAASDVFVLSSHREGLPVSVLEAMAAGRPVVATSVGDIPRVVRDGQTGILVEPGRTEDLARALTRLFRSPSLAAELGAGGRRAVAQYSVSSMIRRHEALYDSIPARITHGAWSEERRDACFDGQPQDLAPEGRRNTGSQGGETRGRPSECPGGGRGRS